MTIPDNPCAVKVTIIDAVTKAAMKQWCDDTYGFRLHWSFPMRKQPWWIRRSIGANEYTFTFQTEENATMFMLRWK